MAERWLPARYDAGPPHRHYGLHNVYHPVIRAIAPPQCQGAWVRVPVASALQLGVDVTCGALTAGCALGAALVGRRAFAVALLSEHKLQLAVAFIVLVQAVIVGAALGLAMAFIG